MTHTCLLPMVFSWIIHDAVVAQCSPELSKLPGSAWGPAVKSERWCLLSAGLMRAGKEKLFYIGCSRGQDYSWRPRIAKTEPKKQLVQTNCLSHEKKKQTFGRMDMQNKWSCEVNPKQPSALLCRSFLCIAKLLKICSACKCPQCVPEKFLRGILLLYN